MTTNKQPIPLHEGLKKLSEYAGSCAEGPNNPEFSQFLYIEPELRRLSRQPAKSFGSDRDLQDMAMLIRRLARLLPEHKVASQAMGYLKRKNLLGSPLREEENILGALTTHTKGPSDEK